jgi:integrase
VLPALGPTPLRRLSRADIKDFLSGLLRAGLAKKTVSNVRGVLHTCLQGAMEDLPDLLPSNPAAFRGGLRLRASLGERRAKAKALTAPELQALLAAARTRVPDRYPVMRFMAGAGCRPGEALGLQWQDLDLEAGHALIRRAVTEGRVEPTKTGHERQIDLGPGLVLELQAWDAASKAQALATGSPRGPWVFSRASEPPGLRALEDDFHAAARAAKIAPWHTPHHLRHTYASLSLAAGESIYYVQRQLGHATIQMTVDLYGSWLPAGSRETAARIEERALGVVSDPVSSSARRGSSRGRPRPASR